MSKLSDLEARLERFTEKLANLDVERESLLDEIESMREKIEAIMEAVNEQIAIQNEAYATLITQRTDEGKITDADFLTFERAAGLSNGGLIDEEPETGEEIPKVVNI